MASGMRVWLEDKGQDLIYIDIDDKGTIHTYPYEGWLWYDHFTGFDRQSGRFAPKKLKKGDTVRISESPQHKVVPLKYRVTKVEMLAEVKP